MLYYLIYRSLHKFITRITRVRNTEALHLLGGKPFVLKQTILGLNVRPYRQKLMIMETDDKGFFSKLLETLLFPLEMLLFPLGIFPTIYSF